jgi:hypothetical protein
MLLRRFISNIKDRDWGSVVAVEKDTEGTIIVVDYSYEGPVLGFGVAF